MNAVVRPLIVLLTLPLTVLTLGLFLLVINYTPANFRSIEDFVTTDISYVNNMIDNLTL